MVLVFLPKKEGVEYIDLKGFKEHIQRNTNGYYYILNSYSTNVELYINLNAICFYNVIRTQNDRLQITVTHFVFYPNDSHSKFYHFNRLPTSVLSGSRNMATWLSTPVSLTM